MAATNFVWDIVNDAYLSEVDDSGTPEVTYTCAPQHFGGVVSENRAGSRSYSHFDGTASTRTVTDATGTSVASIVYASFGKPLFKAGMASTPFLFGGYSGLYWDAVSGSYYARARQYSTAAGRFYSSDPLYLRQLGLVYSYSQYAFARNNPVNRADPSGLADIPILPIGTESVQEDIARRKKEIDDGLQRVLDEWKQSQPPFEDPQLTTCCENEVDKLLSMSATKYGIKDTKEQRGDIVKTMRKIIGPRSNNECNLKIQCKFGCGRGGYGDGDTPGMTKPGKNVTVICLDARNAASTIDILLFHESMHAQQFCDGRVITNLTSCQELEGEIYTEQCKLMYPSDPRKQEECFECGVKFSCAHLKGPPPPERCAGKNPTQPCWTFKITDGKGKFVWTPDDPRCRKWRPE